MRSEALVFTFEKERLWWFKFVILELCGSENQFYLEKRTVSRNELSRKTLLFVAGIFLVVIFLFPCDIVVICLCPTYRVMMVQYFSIMFFIVLWGLRVVLVS